MAGKVNTQSPAVLEKKLFVNTFAEFATKAVKLGQVIQMRGHTVNGVGGGNFTVVNSAGLTADTGYISATGSAGLYVIRQNAKKTPYEFGYQDGGVDASVAINACSTAHGVCYLDAGKTYNLQYQVNVKVFRSQGGKSAELNLTSPTGNNRFGGPTTEFGNSAAVMALGSAGNPLEGVDIQGIQIKCNKLINATGSTGVKGFVFARCKNFYQRDCTVVESASYAFWDYDVANTGVTYCSGTREDCRAVDCSVSFEQVNVRGVKLNNCHGYISSAALGYTPECIFHPYGGADMRVTYSNCTGIADGRCPTIFAAVLNCKNVNVNDCQFINNFDGAGDIQAAVYFGPEVASFDRINFKNCILTSFSSIAVSLTPGASGSASASFAFTDCKISGKNVGVGFSGNGGVYSFTNCIVRGDSIGGTAFGYYTEATGATVQVTGGSSTGAGGTLPQASNLSLASFNKTILTPAASSVPVIRQQKYGTAVLEANTGYSQVVVQLPGSVLNDNKVSYSMAIDATGAATGPDALALATPLVMVHLGPGSQNYRIVAAEAAAGRKVNYGLVEYE